MDLGASAPLPRAFVSPVALRRLNPLAVACTLAACTGVVAALFDNASAGPLVAGNVCSATTLAFALLWAGLLRTRFGRFPAGWVLAIPLAALNAGTSLGVLLSREGGSGSFFGGLFLGTTLGAIVWVPALIATLVVFGVPLWLGQRAAGEGLDREERGERTVALVASVLALGALAGVGFLRSRGHDAWWLLALASAGLVSGAGAAADATRRGRGRRAFLERVESGDAPGFRIDELPDQPRHLVRVTGSGEAGYRAPRLAEPLAELDERGEVKRLHTGLW